MPRGIEKKQLSLRQTQGRAFGRLDHLCLRHGQDVPIEAACFPFAVDRCRRRKQTAWINHMARAARVHREVRIGKVRLNCPAPPA